MPDFNATINLDVQDQQLTSVEQRLDALNGKRVSVDLDMQGMTNIQNQLNQLNNFKIDKINLNTGNIVQVVQRAGQNAGRSFTNGFNQGIMILVCKNCTLVYLNSKPNSLLLDKLEVVLLHNYQT